MKLQALQEKIAAFQKKLIDFCRQQGLIFPKTETIWPISVQNTADRLMVLQNILMRAFDGYHRLTNTENQDPAPTLWKRASKIARVAMENMAILCLIKELLDHRKAISEVFKPASIPDEVS